MPLAVAIFPPGEGVVLLSTQDSKEEDEYLAEGTWLYDFGEEDWYSSIPNQKVKDKFKDRYLWDLRVFDDVPSEVKAAFLLIKE